jgi:5-methyltetrahydrofolate--homocysteine methyltransferase
VPTPAVLGQPRRQGHQARRRRRWLDHRATFMGQWGLRGTARTGRATRSSSRPRASRGCGCGWTGSRPTGWPSSRHVRLLALPLRGQHARRRDAPEDPGARDSPGSRSRGRRRDRRLCLADFFRDAEEAAELGPRRDRVPAGHDGQPRRRGDGEAVRRPNAYRDYLELHGLSVQLTEALAEMWHAGVREELGLGAADADVDAMIRDQAYRGSRYSFGYPACPDLEDRAKLVAAARARADRGRAERGAAAAPRAVHRRARRPPPGGEVLQASAVAAGIPTLVTPCVKPVDPAPGLALAPSLDGVRAADLLALTTPPAAG